MRQLMFKTKTRSFGLAAGLIALLLVMAGIAVAMSSSAEAAGTTRNFLVTLYGWPDNSPPGSAIAYPDIHQTAGGEGTYADPVTFATDQSELAPGTIIYYPYLHRYFIMEDDCTECDEDWTGQGPDGGAGQYHIDLWIGGEGGDANDVVNCEDALTQSSSEVVVDPPNSEPVDTTPLFDSSDNACYDPSSFQGSPAVAPSPTGSPATSASLSASPSAEPSTSDTSPSAAPASPSVGASQTVVATPTSTSGASGGSYQGIAGPGCANSGGAEFNGIGFSGGGSDDWDVVDGNDGTGSGCSDRFLAMPMSGEATQDAANRGQWVFDTGLSSGTCTVTVYIPQPHTSADEYEVDGTTALYGVFDGTSTGNDPQIGHFTINQVLYRGGSVVEGSFEISRPDLILRLFDRGVDYLTTPNAMYGVAAVQATCSA
jgi:hypothetical protein